jgi:hypothetical protein
MSKEQKNSKRRQYRLAYINMVLPSTNLKPLFHNKRFIECNSNKQNFVVCGEF